MRPVLVALLLFPCSVIGQGLVGHDPQNRTVLLEMFTGIHCGNCPAAHAIARGIETAHPEAVTLVGVHGGPLAVPSAGEPDFRTAWGPTLLAQFGFTATPQGMVDRQGVLAPNMWGNTTDEQLGLPSAVNLGMASRFDVGTRELTVDVELYYTADGTDGNDHITVLLVQDGIVGWQTDYINGNQTSYVHDNVLRAYITDIWGDEVTTNSLGDGVTRSYTYTVPVEWDIARCRAVAFVGEFKANLYQARNVAADGGTTVGIGAERRNVSPVPGQAYPLPALDRVTIPLEGVEGGAVLQLRDATGRLVLEERLSPGQARVHVAVGHLANGTYHYGIAGAALRPLVVLR